MPKKEKEVKAEAESVKVEVESVEAPAEPVEVKVSKKEVVTTPVVVSVKTLNGRVITFSSSTHEDAKRAAIAYAQKCGGALLD